MEPGLCEIFGCSILLGPPGLICWTVAVLVVRSLSDRPITLRVVWEAFTAGVLVAILWVFPAWLIAFLAGSVVFVPLYWTNATGRLELPAIVPAIAVATLAVAIYWWRGFWPIAVAEWKRVTFEDGTNA